MVPQIFDRIESRTVFGSGQQISVPCMKSFFDNFVVWKGNPDKNEVLDESRSFFRVHTGYFSNIPKCIKAEFIASWACSQSSVVSSSKR
ncbi:hypothetical protein TNCV_3884511 [Trichonephila clavipes]|nr:hypothetical protein TNCV_3884511 [Trichonephila clavipes]